MQEMLKGMGSIPGSGRSPGGGNGSPLQYLCLENPMDRGACWLRTMGSQRVGHNRSDLAHIITNENNPCSSEYYGNLVCFLWWFKHISGSEHVHFWNGNLSTLLLPYGIWEVRFRLVFKKKKKKLLKTVGPLSEVAPRLFTSAMVTVLIDWRYSHAGNNARKTGFARLRLHWPKNSRKWLYFMKPSVLREIVYSF